MSEWCLNRRLLFGMDDWSEDASGSACYASVSPNPNLETEVQ